ncbi:MAG: class I SAM-dependent methyltransferase [Pseudomonadota bacterium]
MDEGEELQGCAMGEHFIAGYLKKLDSKYKRSVRRARYLKRHMAGRRVIDVGSNIGLFARACRSLGLEPEGLEINETLVKYAREQNPDIPFHCSPLEKFESGDGFDGLYCSEVIEHSVDVQTFAQGLFNLLKPGGVMFLTTPSVDEYMKSGKVYRDLGAPDHKLYFNKQNITQFLQGIGFVDIKHKLSFGGGLKVLAKRP